MSTKSVKAVTLFYCYAREDEHLLNELEKHLAPLKRQGYLTGWHNRQIEAGADWRQEIERHLSAANLILLLLSPDFVHSDACDEEMRRALELHHVGRARVIPLLFRPVLWEGTPLADLEGLPENGQPITVWPNQDQAFHQIAYRLTNIVREQLNLSPLQTQDWQALLSPTLFTFSSSSQQFIDDPSFVPRNPYRGLHPFTAANAADFFGRDRLIEDLLQTFQKTVSSSLQRGSARLLSIVGPSGSGKSSVVLAGLLPALQRGELPGSEGWTYLEPIVPGQHPLEALARTLSYHFPQRSLVSLQEDLAEPAARGLYLLLGTLTRDKAISIFMYIDQFEEVFTQTLEEEERTQFLMLLLTALTEPHSPLSLVISLRADFYDRPMLQVPKLFRLMKTAQAEVLSLDQRDLRDVIKKPAALPDVQLRFEDDLIGELLAEMRGQSGALPLLQFTLDQLFQARQGQALTLAAYHAMGGVQGALAQHAETIYASLVTDEHRALTRALFLCMVNPGTSDQNPTRRRVVLSELALNNPTQRKILDEVATTFTGARLLTTTSQEGKAIVEVSHETILRGWARLANWLHDAHEDLYLQRRVREDMATWIRQGRSATRLYHGEQLEEAIAWKQRSLLSHDEELFLQTGVSEQEQQQLLTKQNEALQRKRYRRRTMLTSMGALGLAVVAAVGSTEWLLNHQPPPPLALPYTYIGHIDEVNSVAWSPDSSKLASASNDGTVRVWDTRTGKTLLIYRGHTSFVTDVAWSLDGSKLASASDSPDSTVQVWKADTGKLFLTYRDHKHDVTSVAWSPDNSKLASISRDGLEQIWDARTGKTLLSNRVDNMIWDVTWSPDGSKLASASQDSTVQVWDTHTGKTLLTYKGQMYYVVNSVAWSPDGSKLASAGGDHTVQVCDAYTGKILLIYKDHKDTIASVAWSPDGSRLASASHDYTVQVWDANTGKNLQIYNGHADYVLSVAWSPDGRKLASAGADRSVQEWLAP